MKSILPLFFMGISFKLKVTARDKATKLEICLYTSIFAYEIERFTY